ncbi:UDP-glycosyltransferase [Nymphaea thermarum]|nr:UDP-glycosyltransferase [Nymphaea thermarum]
MVIPHALVVPLCAQGHVAPLMELSHHLADQDVIVTFVYTEFVHKHVMAALPQNFRSNYSERIRLVTIPDGAFWAEDFSCINWLDRQPACSVVYVSLGSITILSKHQLGELALGLELTERPFLWVSRPTIMDYNAAVYPEGFMDRIARRGLVVDWAPQKEVLSHPSVACFLTHCGWNSTMEGLFNGVPMLGWPYIADQFLNQTCIVDLWKVGLMLVRDEDGVVGKEEIKKKIEDLMNDEGIRKRVSDMKEKGKRAVIEGGASFDNLNGFVHTIKSEAGNQD